MNTKTIDAIVTMPPYAPFIKEVLRHKLVSGIRLNTVMPLKESKKEALKRIYDLTKENGKDFWLDLKCRQLRVKTFGVPPFTELELSHEIDVYTPCKAYFSDRNESATILAIDRNRLIMQEGPRRVVGPGESVTIPHPTLKVKGYLTDEDKKYIESAREIGINNLMLSFVEGEDDIDEVRRYAGTASLIAKIESQKGLDYVANRKDKSPRLMVARGDLFMELHWPHAIIEATEKILSADKYAIVASRILSSLANQPEPSCEDIGDTDNLIRMGYKTLMFGDEICLKRDSIISGLNVLNALTERRK